MSQGHDSTVIVIAHRSTPDQRPLFYLRAGLTLWLVALTFTAKGLLALPWWLLRGGWR